MDPCARAVCWVALLAVLAVPARAEDALIPLQTLLGPAETVAPLLSPDGRSLSWIAPYEGAPNLWVAPIEAPSRARAVTRERGRGLQAFDVNGDVMYRWTSDSKRIVYPKDHDGDENWNWYVLELASGKSTNVTPREGSQVRLLGLGEREPAAALVGINDRDPSRHDLYRVELDTGRLTLIEKNERFVAFVADRELRPRIGVAVLSGGMLDVQQSDGDGRWRPLAAAAEGRIPRKAIGMDAANRVLYALSPSGRNTSALSAWELKSGSVTQIAADERVDVGHVLLEPGTGKPQAYSTNYTRVEWHAIDPRVQPDLDRLKRVAGGDFDVLSRSRDDRRWLIKVTRDDGPEAVLLYERPAGKVRRLFVSHPALEGLPLSKLHPVVIPSRDSLQLVSYVSLPRWTDPDGDGVPSQPLPTVMLVHGGPSDERAEFGFAPFLQWLTNRGYAVLNVNFRGSPGFGKAFQDAERLEWGGKMNLDLVDQAEWAVKQGIADPKRIGIMGGSYGGYATLCAMTLTPGVFACGIDLVGPANLETFIEHMPKTWSLDHLARRIGDPRTPEGLAHLRARSPIHFVDRIREPMLIAQGAHDSRVAQSESDSMVAALDRRGVKVTYLLYPDEGHGFHRPGNSASFYAVTEAFLAAHLGGRCEPLSSQLHDSSVEVPVGAQHVPGLELALERRKGTAH